MPPGNLPPKGKTVSETASATPLGRPRTRIGLRRAGRRKANPSSMAQLKATITLDALRHLVEEEIFRRDPTADRSVWRTWPKGLWQDRISKAEANRGGNSKHPMRTLRVMAKYAVEHQIAPTWACFEFISGYLTDTRPRKQFEEWRVQIATSQLDGLRYVVTLDPDRFTRDRLIGENWMKTLSTAYPVVDLAIIDWGRPTPWSTEKENDIATRFVDANRETGKTSGRINLALDDILHNQQRLISGYEDATGHRVIKGRDENGDLKSEALGWSHDPEATREVAAIRELSRRITANPPEPLSTVARDMEARYGVDILHSSWKRVLTAPRMNGCIRRGGRYLPGTKKRVEYVDVKVPFIEPILSDAQLALNRELFEDPSRHHLRAVSRPLANLGFCKCGLPLASARRTHGEPCMRCASMTEGIAHDGDATRHVSRSERHVAKFLGEVAYAAIHALEQEVVASANEHAGRNDALRAELDALVAEQQALLQRKREFATALADQLVDADTLRPEAARVNAHLQEVARKAVAVEARVREWEAPTYTAAQCRTGMNDPNILRYMVRRTMTRFTLGNVRSQSPYDSIGIQFVPGYEVPAHAMEALRAELTAEYRESAFRRPANPGLNERIWKLWCERQVPVGEIVAQLNADGETRPSGLAWTAHAVRSLMRAECARRKVSYKDMWVPRNMKYPESTRKVIVKLVEDRGADPARWRLVADELQRMGYDTSDGGPWSRQRVRSLYYALRAPQSYAGRPVLLDEVLGRRVLLMVDVEGKSGQEVADWLNEHGPARRNGLPWDRDAVHTQLRRLRRNAASGD